VRSRNRRKLAREPRPESPARTTAPKPEHPTLPRDLKAPHESWKPPPWEPADAEAFQALQRGEASKYQQQRALEYLIYRAAETYNFPFRPEGDRDTCIALGRQFVGQHIVFLMNLNLSQFLRSGDDGRQ